MTTRKWPVVGLVLAVLWLFVRGVTLESLAGEFLIGLAVGLPTAYALRAFYLEEVAVGNGIKATPFVVLYVLVFLRDVVVANLEVAYRVLHPSLPIEPDVIEIPLRVETDAAITTIANSITLTPGTLTMDHDADTNTLYVHAIAVPDRERLIDPIRTWEDYALRIFDEDADPGDPVPRPIAGGGRGGR